MSRALFISEILRMILLCLDMRTLLLCQRVCRFWLDSMKDSRIQKALFFKEDQNCQKTINPLLAELFPAWFPQMNVYGLPWGIKHVRRQPVAIKKEAFLYRNASWRKMLVQQPPIRRLNYIEYFNGAFFHVFSLWTIPFDDGLRMNACYDMLIHAFGDPSRYLTFAFLWPLDAIAPLDIPYHEPESPNFPRCELILWTEQIGWASYVFDRHNPIRALLYPDHWGSLYDLIFRTDDWGIHRIKINHPIPQIRKIVLENGVWNPHDNFQNELDYQLAVREYRICFSSFFM